MASAVVLQLPDGMSKVLTLEEAYQTSSGFGAWAWTGRPALCCADPGCAPGPRAALDARLVGRMRGGRCESGARRYVATTSGGLSPDCSAGSDFAARRTTLKPLPKQDSGVPEPMATKGTEELPQFHKYAGPQSSASELSPDTVCCAPPNGVGLQRIDRPRRVDRPGAVAKGSTITMQNRRPYRSVKLVALASPRRARRGVSGRRCRAGSGNPSPV